MWVHMKDPSLAYAHVHLVEMHASIKYVKEVCNSPFSPKKERHYTFAI
jgi:hypothetical protein